MTINQLPPEMILWGGTGQAKVMRPVIEACGSKVVAVFDDTVGLKSPFDDVEIHHGEDGFARWIKSRKSGRLGFLVTIGNPHGRVRLKIHDRLKAAGLSPATVAHASAIIAKDAVIGDGCQIHAGAIIETGARIGRECIINTKASVDHECELSDGVEIAPGATLCGLVKVGVNGWVCAGATVLPRISIGADAILGAGAVANRDIPAGTCAVGVPARPLAKDKRKKQ